MNRGTLFFVTFALLPPATGGRAMRMRSFEVSGAENPVAERSRASKRPANPYR
jgi:hypothetical protein